MKRNRTARSSRRRASRSHAFRGSRSFRPFLEQLEDRRLLATVTVNTTSDVSDGTTTSIAALLATPGADGFISLREAILAANNTVNVDGSDADSNPDPDVINFNISGGGVETIVPTSILPTISDAVVIDGYSQPGASANTLAVGSDAILLIEINGSAIGNSALVLGGTGGSTVRGLVINRAGGASTFSAGISVSSSNNIVAGNFIGTNAAGTAALGNPFNGVTILGDNNLIGGTTPAARNLISGNQTNSNGFGNVVVGSAGANPTGTVIRGNYIGTNAAGTAALTTNSTGIRILTSVNTTIGGSDLDDGALDGQVGARNLISGNSFAGIHIEPVTGVSDRRIDGIAIAGNFIGVNASGTAAVNNNGTGIYAIEAYNTFNLLIGGTAPGAGNVVSGHRSVGIQAGALQMTVQGNFIGTDLSGTLNLGNGTGSSPGSSTTGQGIQVLASGFTGLTANYQITIGGTTPAARNIISGNNGSGVFVAVYQSSSVTSSVTIQGNYIGTKADGQSPLPNRFAGIDMSSGAMIGGTSAGAGNVIAFNSGKGVSAPPGFFGLYTATILGNSIHSNGNMGIDLNGAGVSLNDTGDADEGNNQGQNFPVITSATTTTIQGTLNSTANGTFRVELFASVAADFSGFGEGQTYLGFTTVTTDGTGNGSFSFTPAAAVPAGQFITSTATDSLGNTSEFSAIRAIPANRAPTITSNGGGDSASINVPENTTVVTTVTATDPDAGTTLTYSIAGGADASKFSINGTSGVLAFLTAPDFEAPADADTNNSYLVIVQASDGSLTDLQTLTVTVTNANEPPAITSNGGGDSASVSVPENTTAVTTVTANDPDAGTTLTYSIVGGADAGKFSLNATSGALAFITTPNFEAPTDADANNSYVVIVQASDGSSNDAQALTVTVTNANEPPVITSNGGSDSANVSVPENTTAVTTMTATDPDAGTTLAYSISGGADAAQFAIDPSSGVLTFITAPNFEAPSDTDGDNVYEVVVAASDGSSNDAQALTVTVTNANEPPVITSNGGSDSASVSVPENTTAVTTIMASDPDLGTTLSYSIVGGADASQFAIDPSSGVLTFIAAPNFEAPSDADGDNVYDVVVATSDGSLTDSQALTVTVTNANESPVITSNGGGDSAGLSVPENTTAVTMVTSADPDAGDTRTFAISGGADAGKFTIDANSGVLRFTTAPDFEAPADAGADNVYVVQVQVSDGALTDMQTISVTVTDVAEGESPVYIGQGCCDPTALVVHGTEGNDKVRIIPQGCGGSGSVKVVLNGQEYFFAAGSFTSIVVHGKGGDDDIGIAGAIDKNACLDGGAGNDRLQGGSGDDILLGGEGSDALHGGQGRDLLIGGLGADRLVGNADDDILIAGTTDHDANDDALCAIMAEWTRCDLGYVQRVAHLRNGGGRNGDVKLYESTVHDDDASDRLTGSAGRDWFFANLDCGGVRDVLTDDHCNEFATDVD